MRMYRYEDGAYEFAGSVSVRQEDGWAEPWRIDYARIGLYPHLNAAVPGYYETPNGAQCTGVRLRFETDASSVELDVAEPADGMRLDVWVDGRLLRELDVRSDDGAAPVSLGPLPEGRKLVELWLDPQHRFRLRGVRVPEGAIVTRPFGGVGDGVGAAVNGGGDPGVVRGVVPGVPGIDSAGGVGRTGRDAAVVNDGEDRSVVQASFDSAGVVEIGQQVRMRWVHHGSSISHVPLGSRPSQIWPALAANSCGLELTNLGFRGACHLDPMVARTIAGLPADIVTLKLGINVYDGGFTPRTFLPAALGFIAAVRAGQPQTPIVVVSPICSPDRETTPGRSGLSLSDMRAALGEAVEKLRAYGDEHLHLADGLRLLGEADAALLGDGLHPVPEAQPLLARRFVREVLAPHVPWR